MFLILKYTFEFTQWFLENEQWKSRAVGYVFLEKYASSKNKVNHCFVYIHLMVDFEKKNDHYS